VSNIPATQTSLFLVDWHFEKFIHYPVSIALEVPPECLNVAVGPHAGARVVPKGREPIKGLLKSL